MRAEAKFTDPSEASVTITLTGALSEFEALRNAIGKTDLPFWQVQALVSKIDDASRQLRAKVWATEPEEAA